MPLEADMASNGNDPTTGAPRFPETDAPELGTDLQIVADFAAEVGNRMVGTSGERDAYSYRRPGLSWWATDTQVESIYDGSAWRPVVSDTGWIPLPLSTGWTAVSGHTPRGRNINGITYLEGAVRRAAGGSPSSVVSIPTALRHTGGKVTFIGSTIIRSAAGVVKPAEMYVEGATGVVSLDDYAEFDSAVGWVVPLTCSFVRDQ